MGAGVIVGKGVGVGVGDEVDENQPRCLPGLFFILVTVLGGTAKAMDTKDRSTRQINRTETNVFCLVSASLREFTIFLTLPVFIFSLSSE